MLKLLILLATAFAAPAAPVEHQVSLPSLPAPR
jgi:hypothetical protein